MGFIINVTIRLMVARFGWAISRGLGNVMDWANEPNHYIHRRQAGWWWIDCTKSDSFAGSTPMPRLGMDLTGRQGMWRAQDGGGVLFTLQHPPTPETRIDAAFTT